MEREKWLIDLLQLMKEGGIESSIFDSAKEVLLQEFSRKLASSPFPERTGDEEKDEQRAKEFLRRHLLEMGYRKEHLTDEFLFEMLRAVLK